MCGEKITQTRIGMVGCVHIVTNESPVSIRLKIKDAKRNQEDFIPIRDSEENDDLIEINFNNIIYMKRVESIAKK